MKPKAPNEHEDGLLEYLEDIIGTSTYKEDIEKTGVQLEEKNTLRQEHLNRLKIAHQQLQFLEPQKKEAEAFLKLENELTGVKSRLFQLNLVQTKTRIAESDKELVYFSFSLILL